MLQIRDRLTQNTLESSPPTTLCIEVTTRCNLNCVMCGHIYHSLGESGVAQVVEMAGPDSFFVNANRQVKPHDMNEAVLLEMARYIDTASWLCPWMCGEPLLAEMFWKVIDRIKGRTLPRLGITTNGHLLSHRNIEKLRDTPVALISVSMDAARPETYGKLRGARFETVLEGVRRLIKARDSYGWSDDSVSIGMTLMRENIEELAEFIQLASDLGVTHVMLDHLWIYSDSCQPDYWVVKKQDGWEFNYVQQQLRNCTAISNAFVSGAMDIAAKKKIHVTVAWDNDLLLGRGEHVSLSDCPYPWQWLSVMVDGHAVPCSHATRQVVGNVLQDGGAEAVWNGPLMRQLREDIMAGRLNPVCADRRCAYARGGAEGKTV